MKKEISAIINEHLPAQVAGEMKKYIESIEGLRGDLQRSEREVERLQKVEVKYAGEKADLAVAKEETKRNEAWAQELYAKAQEIEKREDRVGVTIMEERNRMMEANMENMKTLVTKVFGHPNVQITRTSHQPYTDQYGNRSSDYVSEDETKTENKV